MTPLEPNTQLKYGPLVHELHDALKATCFQGLRDRQGRKELMTRLLGTGISQAMYLVSELQAAMVQPGDVCEFGVAQGATSALLANEIRETEKTLWLYDSFAGLPKPSSKDSLKDDIFNLGSMARYEGEMRCDIEEVQVRLRQISFPESRVQLRPGLVEETLTDENGPRQVCFAYVDFDFYAGITHALGYLHRHLAPGGRIVVDDYDFFSTGAKTAVDEFVSRHHGAYELILPQAFAGHFCILRPVETRWKRWFSHTRSRK
ncbi:MAG: class I SAM-dependent methyltransferase [Opitutaceae bacterium]|nr:class I SAM-dependent methyltransferase [Opitutaceae bacterium]